MELLANIKRAFVGAPTTEILKNDADQPLNFKDQATNIRKRIRKLNIEQRLDALKASSPLLLLGTGLGLLLMRRYKLGAVVVGGFLLQTAYIGKYPKALLPRHDPNDIELERRAMKAEMGDFGKLEVIPFR